MILDEIRARIEQLDTLLDDPEYEGDDLLMVCLGEDPCIVQTNLAAESSVKILTPTAKNDYTVAIIESDDRGVLERVICPLQFVSKICDLTVDSWRDSQKLRQAS